MDQTGKSTGFRSGDEGRVAKVPYSRNVENCSDTFSEFRSTCVMVLRLAGTWMTCSWRVSLPVYYWCLSAGVKINSMYEFVFTFAPWETKMNGDFHVLNMAAQTMTEEDFWHLKTLLTQSGMSPVDFARMRSFCRLQMPSTVSNFSWLQRQKWHQRCPYHLSFRWEESLLGSIFFLFLEIREMLAGSHFERQQF